MQAILATRKDGKLQDIAEQADRNYKVQPSRVLATETATGSSQNPWATQIEALTKQVATLTEQMRSIAKELHEDETEHEADHGTEQEVRHLGKTASATTTDDSAQKPKDAPNLARSRETTRAIIDGDQ